MASIAILGPGGVGGLLAGVLERSGIPVVIVARPSTTEVIERNGLTITSELFGKFVVQPRVTSELTNPVDVLFVATKALGLELALERVKMQPQLVVPLLNGIDHLYLLRERFGANAVAAGTVRVEADRPVPGQIIHTSHFLRIELASERPELQLRVAGLAEVLNSAKIPTQIGERELDVLWGKLTRLNALALTTTASGATLGFVREDPHWTKELDGCVTEAVAVANAEGVQILTAQVHEDIATIHGESGSSMQRDVANGRTPELEAIPGAILRTAARHGIECPTIQRLTAQITQLRVTS